MTKVKLVCALAWHTSDFRRNNKIKDDMKVILTGATDYVGEGATSIDNVRTTVRKPQSFYSLDGRWHNSLKRGVKIVDGRKVVIR